MNDYNEAIFRPWMNKNPKLMVKFTEFCKESNDYGKSAALKVFHQVVRPDKLLYQEYRELLRDETYVPDRELVELIKAKTDEYGWDRFMIALRNRVRLTLKANPGDSINQRRALKTLDLLQQVPHTLELENR